MYSSFPIHVLHKRNEVGVDDEVRLRLRELHLLVALVVLLGEIENVLVARPAVDRLLDEVTLHHVGTFDLCTAAYTTLKHRIQTILRFTD